MFAKTSDCLSPVTYSEVERFNTKLFHCLQKDVAPGFRQGTLGQVLQADREMWIQVSQHTRGQILTSNPKPIDDDAIKRFADCPEVTYYLLPSAGNRSNVAPPPEPNRAWERPKNKRKQQRSMGASEATARP